MSDLLGGLGGLVKGLTSIMPQDDPNTQLLKMRGEVSDLKKQEDDLYIEIGKMAAERYGLETFGDSAGRMKLIEANLAAAQNKLEEAKGAAQAKEKAEKDALAERICPQCGYENPEGTKFCQECGGKLGAVKTSCPSCGTENPAGVKFCQECGAKMSAAAVTAGCPACGAQNPPGTRFCGGCGAKMEG